jgi:protein Mpv17
MAMAITGLTYFFADWIAQTCEGTTPMDFDAARIMRSTLVGTLVFGPMVHTYYQSQAHLFDALFPSAPWYSEALKIAMDQTMFCFTYNITYYLAMGALAGRPVRDTLGEFRAVWWRLQTAGWKFWPFVGLITHTVVPLKHKVLFVDIAEVCWVTYLSLTANAKKDRSCEDGATGLKVLAEPSSVSKDEVSVNV